MNVPYTMPKPVFEKLLSHLVNLEDDRLELIEELFPETTKEREQFVDFLDQYISKINHEIKNTVTGETEKSFPFVTIGSRRITNCKPFSAFSK